MWVSLLTPYDINNFTFSQINHLCLNILGTNLWCAPEVIDEVDVIDSKADIFSFGLVIYETLALVPPHTLELDAALGEDMDSSHDLPTDTDKLQCKQLDFSSDENKNGLPSAKEEHTDNDMSQDYDEEDDEEEKEEEEEDDEEDDDTKENDISYFTLNNLHSAYGTRPPLPVAFQLSDDYNCVVELFYLCTNALSEDRPAAKTIWQCLENNGANVATESD